MGNRQYSYPSWLKAAVEAALDCVYPPKCGLCGTLGSAPVCAICHGEFEVHGEIDERDHFEFAYACYRYTGRAAQAVKRLKYERVTSLAHWMAIEIADAVEMQFPDFDVAVPVPIHPKRRRHRGFNQAELLCEALGHERTDSGALLRTVYTKPQAGLSPLERQTNLVGAFGCERLFDRDTVLLLDDVCTSGSTARECAKVLREAGARKVLLLTFAAG